MEPEVKDHAPAEVAPHDSGSVARSSSYSYADDPGAPRKSRAFDHQRSPEPPREGTDDSQWSKVTPSRVLSPSFFTAAESMRREFCKSQSSADAWDSSIPELLLPKFAKAGDLALMRKINHGHLDLVTFEECQEMIELLGDDDAVHEVTFNDTDSDFIAFRLNRDGFVDYYSNGHKLLQNLSDITMEGTRLTVRGTLIDGTNADGHFITSVPAAREQHAPRVMDLFNGRKAGKMHKDMLGYLLKEVLKPRFSDVEVEEVLAFTDSSKDGIICTQELFAALSAGPVRHLIKHLQMERMELAQKLDHTRVDLDRDFLLERVRWRVDRDDAFFTLPSAIGLGAVLCVLVICHLQVWNRKQVEWGLEEWMVQANDFGRADVADVDFEDIKDDTGFWHWLDNHGTENIVGTVIDHRNSGNAVARVASSNILLGGLRINQELWLLQPDTNRSFTATRKSPFLVPLKDQLQALTELRGNASLESLHMEFITYSEKSCFFSVFDINVDFDSYGYVKPVMSATAVMFRPYPDVYAYVFDVLYLMLVASLFYAEAGQLVSAAKLGTRVFREYWSVWNILDWVSITMGVSNLALWICCLQAMEDPALTALMTAGDPFRLDIDRLDVTKLSAEQLDGVMSALYQLQTLFLALQLVTLLAAIAVMLKCFKGFRANPRLAVVAITLHNGAKDIGHFFIVFFCIFFVFACTGHALFGTDRPEFYTLASSIKTAFKVLMGDFAWYSELTDNNDERNSLESGMPRMLVTLWFFVFMTLVSLVMLNMLLAVILEQYILVANDSKLPGDTDGTLWTQTKLFYARGRQTRGFIKLSRLKAMLDHDINPAHPDQEVTQKSLLKAFPGMKGEQATWIVSWLHAESLKQLERDKAKEYDPGIISELVRRNARYGNYLSEQLRLVSLGVQNWDSCLGSLGSDMGSLRYVLEDPADRATCSERTPVTIKPWPPMSTLKADMGTATQVTARQCSCGNLLMPDSAFCRMCGTEASQPVAPLRVAVSPYGVLGMQRAQGVTLRQALQPDARVAVLDPAGLHFIQGSPASAGGAAGAVYEWLEIKGDAAFPEPVRAAIQKPLVAKLHRYGTVADPKACIHVVGPDFRELPDLSRQEAVEQLATAYRNALAEFAPAHESLFVFRLLPISGGIFAGRWLTELPVMTAEALQLGFTQLEPRHREQVLRPDRTVEMCIFEEAHLAEYEKAFADVLSNLTIQVETSVVALDSSRLSEPQAANMVSQVASFASDSDLVSLVQLAEESEREVRALQHDMQLLTAKCEAMRASENSVARVQVVRGNLRQERTECCPIASALQRSPTPPEVIN